MSRNRPRRMGLAEWIHHLVEIDENGCWIWPRSKDTYGYGRLGKGGKAYSTHRVMFEEHKHPIPDGLVIDHMCRTRACCNPDHLRVVTRQINSTENVAETITWKLNRAKTTCVQGHPYQGENLIVAGNRRYCRECVRASQRRVRLRRTNKTPDAVTGH